MRPISSVLEPDGQELSTLDLAMAAAAEDLYLDQFTDEEMVWLRHEGSVSNLDEPWLATVGQEARVVAEESGRRSLIARGMAGLADDGELLVAGPAGMVKDFRRDAIVSTRLRLESRHSTQPHLAAFFVVTEGLVMLEDIDPLGFHSFVLMSTDRAATALATSLDPDRSAGDSSGPVQDVGEVEALDPSLEDLKREARQIAMVTSTLGAQSQSRTISLYSLPDAVWAFRGLESPTAARYQLGQCSAGDIAALAHGMMTGIETG